MSVRYYFLKQDPAKNTWEKSFDGFDSQSDSFILYFMKIEEISQNELDKLG